MGDWLRLWPIRFAILVGILNMELVTIPIILKGLLHLSGMVLEITSAVCGTVEMCYWYFFVGWLTNEKIKRSSRIQKTLKKGKMELPKAKEEALRIRQSETGRYYEELFRKEIIDKFDFSKYKNKKLFLFLKGLGYWTGIFANFGLGLAPLIWIVGLVASRTSKFKLWFLALLAGNAFKNAKLWANGWDYIFSMF